MNEIERALESAKAAMLSPARANGGGTPEAWVQATIYEVRQALNSLKLGEVAVVRRDELRELQTTDMALDRAAHLLREVTGTCPADLFEWEPPQSCAETCSDDSPVTCWRLYLARQGG